MKFIELHMKCKVESDSGPDWESMGVDEANIPIKTEFRPIRVRPELIDLFYPNTDGGCFVLIAGMELTMRESYKELRSITDALD